MNNEDCGMLFKRIFAERENILYKKIALKWTYFSIVINFKSNEGSRLQQPVHDEKLEHVSKITTGTLCFLRDIKLN